MHFWACIRAGLIPTDQYQSVSDTGLYQIQLIQAVNVWIIKNLEYYIVSNTYIYKYAKIIIIVFIHHLAVTEENDQSALFKALSYPRTNQQETVFYTTFYTYFKIILKFIIFYPPFGRNRGKWPKSLVKLIKTTKPQCNLYFGMHSITSLQNLLVNVFRIGAN